MSQVPNEYRRACVLLDEVGIQDTEAYTELKDLIRKLALRAKGNDEESS